MVQYVYIYTDHVDGIADLTWRCVAAEYQHGRGPCVVNGSRVDAEY